MGVAAERLRDDLVELRLNVVWSFPGCEAGPVADAEHVRVYRKCFRAEYCI
jgi:hypothetical protein